MLDRGEIVCVTREQKAGDRDWAYIAYKIPTPNARTPVAGWTDLRALKPLSPEEIAIITKALPPAPVAKGPPPAPAPAPPRPPAPAAEAPPANEVIRFTEPVPFGPYPVNGHSIEQLINGVPTFPPFEGLEESAWKRTCSSCHKWDRETLCEQGATYAKNPQSALRNPHPYGGGLKTVLMQWAKTGCQ
jgi:hypothetical protein